MALTIPTTTGAGKAETSRPRPKNAATAWQTPAKPTTYGTNMIPDSLTTVSVFTRR